jgi:hypothetical protein
MRKSLTRILVFSLILLLARCGISFSAHMQEDIFYDYFCPLDTHTYNYASIMEFCSGDNPDACPGGIHIGTNPHWPDSLFWSHTLPPGLSVPPYQITRARLWIDGQAVNTENDSISIQGILSWDPLNPLTPDTVSYDLSGVSVAGFWNQGSLDIIVGTGESLIRLDHAELLLDYDGHTDVEEEEVSSSVGGFGLSQNYPNPFNPETQISFNLPERATVSLEVYNVFGQKVRVLINAILPAGSYNLTWDGTDSEGNSLASGVYFCRLSAGAKISTSKMILMK